MATNRLRRTRSVSKYLVSVDSRLASLKKRPAPRKLKSNVIQAKNLKRHVVTTSSLATESITATKMAINSVSSFALQDGSVTSDTLAPEVVAEISTATSLGSVALASANGKNAVYRGSTQPTTGNDGDIWFDSGNGNKLHRRVAGAWVAFTLGNDALASISASKITAGTIDASVVTVENLDAGNITVGALTGISIELSDGTTTNFSATNTGFLTAVNANITGFIRANTGFIGRWEVEASGRLVSISDTSPMIFSPTENDGTGAIAAAGISIGNGDISANNIALYDSGGIYYFGNDGSSHGISFVYDESQTPGQLFAIRHCCNRRRRYATSRRTRRYRPRQLNTYARARRWRYLALPERHAGASIRKWFVL